MDGTPRPRPRARPRSQPQPPQRRASPASASAPSPSTSTSDAAPEAVAWVDDQSVYGSYYGGEGSGGREGLVIPLDMTGDGVWEAVYTLPVLLGSNGQNVSLQVDTGSSDLWVVSSTCTSSTCAAVSPADYDPAASTSSTPTGKPFAITYLEGAASGPILWDTVAVGTYNISNQALAAVTSVTSEPLDRYFAGILGLALSANSVIAQAIPPVDGGDNAPDGAVWADNLFGLTPASASPASRFLALSLARPGSNRVPSLLAIGLHPSFIANASTPSSAGLTSLAASDITYASVPIPETDDAAKFWRAEVTAVSVWVGGAEGVVDVEQPGRFVGGEGGIWPQAVLDSGTPTILANRWLADAVYGALGISMSSDGNYYLPCTTPINMTVTLSGHAPVALHPLDLSAPPASDYSSSTCVGLIQVPAQPLAISDMVLGVAFLRSTYMVMAYEAPNQDGAIGDAAPYVSTETEVSFSRSAGVSVSSGAGNVSIATVPPTSTSGTTNFTRPPSTPTLNAGSSLTTQPARRQETVTSASTAPVTTTTSNPYAINPQLGILPLTNATVALAEFSTVRVLREPLPSVYPNGSIVGPGGANGPSSSGGGGGGGGAGGRRGLSTGLVVLVALLSFLGLVVVAFGAWWMLMRRKLKRERGAQGVGGEEEEDGERVMRDGGYAPVMLAALRTSHSHTLSTSSNDETLGGSLGARGKTHAVKGSKPSLHTPESSRTFDTSGVWVEQASGAAVGAGAAAGEDGVLRRPGHVASHSFSTSYNGTVDGSHRNSGFEFRAGGLEGEVYHDVDMDEGEQQHLARLDEDEGVHTVDLFLPPVPPARASLSPSYLHSFTHTRYPSDPAIQPAVDEPLLGHAREQSLDFPALTPSPLGLTATSFDPEVPPPSKSSMMRTHAREGSLDAFARPRNTRRTSSGNIPPPRPIFP